MPTNPTVSNQPTAQELSELQRYSAQLNSRLKAAWRSPNLGGAQVSVTVVFDVTASGQIINLQLKPASGQFTFDQSIRDVFRKVANAGPTPTGRGHRFSMGFESTR
jgi:TonB family protein